MSKSMTTTLKLPDAVCGDVLTKTFRAKVQQSLAQAVQIKAEASIAARSNLMDAQGHRSRWPSNTVRKNANKKPVKI